MVDGVINNLRFAGDEGESGINNNDGGVNGVVNGGMEENTFPILVSVRVDNQHQVAKCTAMLSAESRNRIWRLNTHVTSRGEKGSSNISSFLL